MAIDLRTGKVVIADDEPHVTISLRLHSADGPPTLLLDTTIVVEALLPFQPNHAACVAFLDRIAGSETTLSWLRDPFASA